MWPYKCPVIPLFGILGLNLMFPCYKSIVISRLYSKLNHLVQAYNASAQCWTVGVSLYSGVVFERVIFLSHTTITVCFCFVNWHFEKYIWILFIPGDKITLGKMLL